MRLKPFKMISWIEVVLHLHIYHYVPESFYTVSKLKSCVKYILLVLLLSFGIFPYNILELEHP